MVHIVLAHLYTSLSGGSTTRCSLITLVIPECHHFSEYSVPEFVVIRRIFVGQSIQSYIRFYSPYSPSCFLLTSMW